MTGVQTCALPILQTTVTIGTAPASPNNRIDLVVIDAGTGAASVVAGTPASSPSAPAIPAGKRQICQVSVPNGTSAIAANQITDLRAVWGHYARGIPFCIAGGSADALTGTFTPATPAESSALDGYIWRVRAAAANATTTPTWKQDAWTTARTIKKINGAALNPGDIGGANHELLLGYNYNGGSPFIELLNPAPAAFVGDSGTGGTAGLVPAPPAGSAAANYALLANGTFGAISAFTTGDVKMTIKTVPDTGWVMMNDGTIGSASSGATTRANADCQNLFELLWNNISNSYCAVSSGRGATAAADWAANKTIQLPLALGRALAVSGAGAGLTSYALGQTTGENTHTLTATEMPSHSHSYSAPVSAGHDLAPWACPGGFAGTTGSGSNTGGAGSGGAHNNMQPTSFLNVMIKL